MMNMFQLQERIKDFSKDQLVREMQQPSGAVPPFLVLSELQRRTRMEKAFQAEQAQGQQFTVAQDAVNAAGVPQGGIADMARAMAPQTDMAGNTGAIPVQNMYGGGQVKRMQPGGLTRNAQQDEIDAMARQLAEMVARLEEANQRAFGDSEPRLSSVSEDVGSFMPAPLRAPSMGAGVGSLPSIDVESDGARTAPGLPSIRPTDRQPILDEPAPPSFRELARPATVIGPEQGPNLPSMEDAARMRAINVTPGASGFPAQRDLDMRFAQEQRDAAAARAATAGQTPDPTSIIMSDGVMGPIDDRPTPTADAFRAELESRPARTAEAARMMAINEIPELSTFDPFEYMRGGTEVGPATLDPLSESVRNVITGAAETLAFPGFMPPMQGPELPPGGMPKPPPAPPPAPKTGGMPKPPPAPPPAPKTGGESGGTGGAGGRGRGLDTDRMLEQDKWLALAQFGLGLMGSQQPTLGGAIGEAGTMALGQLGRAREAAVERDLAERTLAARTAGAGRTRAPSFSNLLSYANSRITAANAALESLAMENITDLKTALAAGRGDAYQQAVRDLQEGNELLRSLGPTMAGAGSLSDVDIDLTQ